MQYEKRTIAVQQQQYSQLKNSDSNVHTQSLNNLPTIQIHPTPPLRHPLQCVDVALVGCPAHHIAAPPVFARQQQMALTQREEQQNRLGENKVTQQLLVEQSQDEPEAKTDELQSLFGRWRLTYRWTKLVM